MKRVCIIAMKGFVQLEILRIEMSSCSMFHALVKTSPSAVYSLYVPGRSTSATMDGPSHGGDSLWRFDLHASQHQVAHRKGTSLHSVIVVLACGGTTQNNWARVFRSLLLGNADPKWHSPAVPQLKPRLKPRLQDRTDNTHTKVIPDITTQIISYISEFAAKS